jgi:hypothetical protein
MGRAAEAVFRKEFTVNLHPQFVRRFSDLDALRRPNIAQQAATKGRAHQKE